MSRFLIAVVILVLLFPASRLFAIEVCLVNDSKHTTAITVISGSDRWGKEPSKDERFPQLKAELVKSLRSTTKIDPKSNASLKKFVHQFSLAERNKD